MTAVRVPAGKIPETSLKIFLRVPPTTSPSTSPTLDFVNLAINVSTTEATVSTSTPRFRTVTVAGWTSEKERGFLWLSKMRNPISVASWNNEHFFCTPTSNLAQATAPVVSKAAILGVWYLRYVTDGRGRIVRGPVGRCVP